MGELATLGLLERGTLLVVDMAESWTGAGDRNTAAIRMPSQHASAQLLWVGRDGATGRGRRAEADRELSLEEGSGAGSDEPKAQAMHTRAVVHQKRVPCKQQRMRLAARRRGPGDVGAARKMLNG
jgi:hypothetical protein